MDYKEHFTENRIPQVKAFINDLPIDDLSVNKIMKKYFKNSRSFYNKCIEVLEEQSVIEVERRDRTWVDGKWVTNCNRYTLKNAPIIKQTKKDVKMFEKDGGYYHIESPTHYDIFKRCLKLTESTFGSVWKNAVIEECMISGLDQDQAEHIWNEYEKHLKKNGQV